MLREIADWVMYVGMGISMAAGATWPRPSWGGWGVGLAVIAVGVVLRRKAGAPSLHEVHAPGEAGDDDAPRGSLEQSIAWFAKGVGELAKSAPEQPFEAIKQRAERLVRGGPERVGNAQEALAAKIGFATYAEIMAPLASAERWVNRAWSAAADEHRPECVSSLEQAAAFAREAEALSRGKIDSPS